MIATLILFQRVCANAFEIMWTQNQSFENVAIRYFTNQKKSWLWFAKFIEFHNHDSRNSLNLFEKISEVERVELNYRKKNNEWIDD